MQDKAILQRAGIGIVTVVAIGVAAAMTLDRPNAPSTSNAGGSGASSQSALVAAPVAQDDRPIGARRQTFPVDEVDAQDLIDKVSAPWLGPTFADVRADRHSGGYGRSITSASGSANIYTLADGQVWNLQLRSGTGRDCGRAKDIAPHIAEIYSALQPGRRLRSEALATLVAGLDSPTARHVTVDGVRISTVGECIRSLDIRTVLEGDQT